MPSSTQVQLTWHSHSARTGKLNMCHAWHMHLGVVRSLDRSLFGRSSLFKVMCHVLGLLPRLLATP